MLCNDEIISVPTLIDTGAIGFAFIDEDFACHHNLELYCLKNPVTLKQLMENPFNLELSPI
jgi:hypothetical protein